MEAPVPDISRAIHPNILGRFGDVLQFIRCKIDQDWFSFFHCEFISLLVWYDFRKRGMPAIFLCSEHSLGNPLWTVLGWYIFL